MCGQPQPPTRRSVPPLHPFLVFSPTDHPPPAPTLPPTLYHLPRSDEGMVWGREPCPAMIRSALIVDGMPERFHPKSFRSVISFNTNIWASRNARLARHLAGPPVGIIPLDVPMNASWFPPADRPSDLAVGGRSCQGLRDDARKQGLSEDDRASLLVPHHCRCGEQLPCKKAEDVADECARRGETPFQD